VLAKWQGALDKARAGHMLQAINAATAADIAVEKARGEKAKAEAALAAKTDDEALKKAVEVAKQAFDTAEAAAKAAKEAVDQRRATFDLEAEVKKLADGRPGLKFITIAEMKDADELRAVPEIGDWQDSHLPGQMSLAGEIHNGRVQNTTKGSFIFQVKGIEERPFKKFEDIKSDLETDYLTGKAEQNAKERKEVFEKALERLARIQLKAEVEKIETDGAAGLEKEFSEWKTGLEQKLEAKAQLLAQLGDPTLRSYKKTKEVHEALEAELKAADAKQATMKEASVKKLEADVKEKLKEAHKDVLEVAGTEAGFKVETLGPFTRKLSSQPRFRYRYAGVIRAVFASQAGEAEVDDVSDLEDDSSNEVIYLAACTAVEKGTPEQITRRQWLAERDNSYQGFAGAQMRQAVERSFTIEALEQSCKWRAPESSDAPSKKRTVKAAGDGKVKGEGEGKAVKGEGEGKAEKGEGKGKAEKGEGKAEKGEK
jgi:hypothetical protein